MEAIPVEMNNTDTILIYYHVGWKRVYMTIGRSQIQIKGKQNAIELAKALLRLADNWPNDRFKKKEKQTWEQAAQSIDRKMQEFQRQCRAEDAQAVRDSMDTIINL